MRFGRAQSVETPPADPRPGNAERETRETLRAAIEQRRAAEAINLAARDRAEQARVAALDARGAARRAHSATIAARDSGLDRAAISALAAIEARLTAEADGATAAHRGADEATDAPMREWRASVSRVEKAARAVVAFAAAPLLAEVKAMHESLVGKVAALAIIEASVDPFTDADLLGEIRAVLMNARHAKLGDLARHDPAGDAWRATVAALLIDADARTPPP